MHFWQKEMKENICSESLRFPSLNHKVCGYQATSEYLALIQNSNIWLHAGIICSNWILTSWYINWYYVCSWCLPPDFRCQALLQIFLKPKIVAAPTRILKAVNHNWDNRTAHIGISISNLFILVERGKTGTFKKSESKDIFYSIHLILKKIFFQFESSHLFLPELLFQLDFASLACTWTGQPLLHKLKEQYIIDWRMEYPILHTSTSQHIYISSLYLASSLL